MAVKNSNFKTGSLLRKTSVDVKCLQALDCWTIVFEVIVFVLISDTLKLYQQD